DDPGDRDRGRAPARLVEGERSEYPDHAENERGDRHQPEGPEHLWLSKSAADRAAPERLCVGGRGAKRPDSENDREAREADEDRARPDVVGERSEWGPAGGTADPRAQGRTDEFPPP